MTHCSNHPQTIRTVPSRPAVTLRAASIAHIVAVVIITTQPSAGFGYV